MEEDSPAPLQPPKVIASATVERGAGDRNRKCIEMTLPALRSYVSVRNVFNWPNHREGWLFVWTVLHSVHHASVE